MSLNQPSKKRPLVLKLLTAGDGGVGKTTLLHRYVDHTFIDSTKMTIGVEFFFKNLVLDEEPYTLQIWDFGGQDQFRFMLEPYARGALGALLLIDMTRPLSLSFLDEWINICRSDKKNIPILFIGTKIDLEEMVCVDKELIEENMQKYDLFDFITVSSKTGYNVDLAFKLLTNEIVKRVKKKIL